MTVSAETEQLRQELQRSIGKGEVKLVRRYGRLPPLKRPSAYRRFRKAVGSLLRRLGLRPSVVPEPWLAGLKHIPGSDEARPLVLWALGAEREELRDACRRFQALEGSLPGFAPVLVTDVADFAFFSRLGWLVEYVPPLSAPAANYAERKRRYLAWRYREATVLPVSAGLQEDVFTEGLRIG